MRCYFEEFTSGIQQERYAVVCIELAPAAYIPSHLNGLPGIHEKIPDSCIPFLSFEIILGEEGCPGRGAPVKR